MDSHTGQSSTGPTQDFGSFGSSIKSFQSGQRPRRSVAALVVALRRAADLLALTAGDVADDSFNNSVSVNILQMATKDPVVS